MPEVFSKSVDVWYTLPNGREMRSTFSLSCLDNDPTDEQLQAIAKLLFPQGATHNYQISIS